MALSLLFGGSSMYRLIHDRLDVGWLAGDSLGFAGFDSLARIIRPVDDEGFVVEFTLPRMLHTVAAARVASRIFDAMRSATHATWPRAVRAERLHSHS